MALVRHGLFFLVWIGQVNVFRYGVTVTVPKLPDVPVE